VDLELLQERARIIRSVRRFFDERNYLETDTPVLAPNLIPESCLEVFETMYLPPTETKTRKKRTYFLAPSPEIWMKRLIADHRVDMYQIGKCFRNGESVGRLHSPEFTMLEYYTIGADYEESLDITEAFFAAILPSTVRKSLSPPFLRLTVEDAFSEFAGFSLFSAVEKGRLEMEARSLGLDPPPNMGTAALYDLIFVHTVEPNLPRDKPVALMDYPSFVPCLAKKSADGLTAERWELYVRGIELANCYSEETDPEKVRSFFEAEAAVKAERALTPHAVDMDYWKVFSTRQKEYPRCSGVAMGMDRLIMSVTGRSSIDSVLPFPMRRF
jgi:lysyl-tRNA synthetase class 2